MSAMEPSTLASFWVGELLDRSLLRVQTKDWRRTDIEAAKATTDTERLNP